MSDNNRGFGKSLAVDITQPDSPAIAELVRKIKQGARQTGLAGNTVHEVWYHIYCIDGLVSKIKAPEATRIAANALIDAGWEDVFVKKVTTHSVSTFEDFDLDAKGDDHD